MAPDRHAPAEPAPTPPPLAGATLLVEYEQFIEDQLRKTRSHVRGVDIAAATMILLAGTLGFFLLAALMDHWLVTGGLGFWGRFLLWATYLGAASYWVGTQIVPLLVKRINPLYAAETIERSRPTLKNTLLNFLFFRANPVGVHQKVLYAIEEQAATKLAGVHVETAVDRTRLIRLGYVVLGILVVGALYTLLSPKDVFKTVRRVAMPWADISPPTRTTIDEITPGDASAFRGQQIPVQARIGGLAADGKVTLYYTTADRQIVDRGVEMSLPPGDYRYLARLPSADATLEQTLSYRIAAGDAVTRPYTIRVVAAPTIVVQSVEYKYPAYTGLLTQRVEHQGDIKAIEGTQVTIDALANQEIASAHVDFECDKKLDLAMRADGETARAMFVLALGDDRQTPEHSSYQVTFKNAAGHENPQPVRHEISVTRDIAPEIQFVAPRQDEIDLPADAAVELEIVAGDPDFALAQVTLSAAKGTTKVAEETLLQEEWRGQFVKKYRFQPRQLGLAEGDVVDYWAVAVDSKDPNPNRTETSRRRIRIVSPTGRQGDRDQLAQNQKRQDGKERGENDKAQEKNDNPPRDEQGQPDEPSGKPATDEGQPGDDNPQGGQPENAEPGKDSPQGKSAEEAGGADQQRWGDGSEASDEQQREEAAEPSVPNDGTNDGEAIERILEHGNQQNQQNPGEGDQREQQPPADKQDQDNQGEKGPQNGGKREGAQTQQPQGEKEVDDQERKPGEKPEKGPPQQGSGADKSGEGRESSEKPQGTKGQQPRDGGQQQEQPSQGEKAQAPGKPDNRQRAKPGEAAAPDGGEQGDTQSQEKPQRGKGADQRQPGGTKDSQSTSEDGKGQTPEQSDGESKPTGKPQDAEQSRDDRSDTAAGERQGDGQPNKRDPKSQATNDNNTAEDGTPQDPSTKGQGANAKDDSLRDADQKKPQDGQQRPDARGGGGENPKGESGGGQKSEDNKGSPEGRTARPTPKNAPPSPDEKEPMPNDEAQSGNTSERESETESQEDGEQSGGGKRGGGQKANKSGTGSAGQNTAADEGAGRSDDAGDGETSDRAGGDRQADGQTGQSGSKTGPGSRTKPSAGENEKPGGDSDAQNASDAPDGSNAPGKGAEGGENPSDSRPGTSSPREQKWKPGVDKADEANLDYARKATDLALEHLQDQLRKGEPDQELLDRLGWTRHDLEKFVKRWEALRKDAQAPGGEGDASRRELDETLRSLGLRPRATSLKSNAGRDDRAQGYKESSRTTPPAEYSEAFKAYTQGTARGGK